MSFNDFMAARRATAMPDRIVTGMIPNYTRDERAQDKRRHAIEMESLSESSSEDGITLETIIAERPKTSEVREFFKVNLAACKSEVMSMFS